MRIVFMGSADFAVTSLEALAAAGHELLTVVTQPDRPRGRGQKLAVTPVKELALKLGLSIYQPNSARAPEFAAWLRQQAPEVVVVVAYGQILPPEVLRIPPQGCINVHASLLPAYRGAAPIHWAIMSGEKLTGVSTMFMDAGMDTGDVVLQQPVPIPDEATTGDLYPRLAKEGAELLLKTLTLLSLGKVIRVPQDNSRATYAPVLKREHEKIDWSKPAEVLRNQIRGLNPWPGAYTEFDGKVLKVWRSRRWQLGGDPDSNKEISNTRRPGEVIRVVKDEGLLVQTGAGCLLLTEVQPTGKKRMPADAFSRGYQIGTGTVFG
jgi:methionyl-tRNA formyltransferase